MEFHFRAGSNDRPSALLPTSSSSFSAPDGFFSAQALRASGPVGGDDEIRKSEVLPEPATAEEARQREIQREQIRQEIMREMAQRRLLEEEVRREIELERALAFRNRIDGFLPLQGVLRRPEMAASLSALVPGARIMDRLGLARGTLDAGASEQPTLPASEEGGSSNVYTVGTKRKASCLMGIPKLPQSPLKEWSCALCKVSATSKEGLDDHLNGKKHKAKEALLIAHKTTVETDGDSSTVRMVTTETWSCSLCRVSTTSEKALHDHIEGRKHKAKEALLALAHKKEVEKGGSTTVPNEADKALLENGDEKDKAPNANVQLAGKDLHGANLLAQKKPGTEGQKKRRKRKRFWCRVCKVKCNSQATLVAHLAGKRHKSQAAESNSGVTNNGTRATTLDTRSTAAGGAGVMDQKVDEKTNEMVEEGKGENTTNDEETDAGEVSNVITEMNEKSSQNEETDGVGESNVAIKQDEMESIKKEEPPLWTRATILDTRSTAAGGAGDMDQKVDEKTNEMVEEGKGENTTNDEETDVGEASNAITEMNEKSSQNEETDGVGESNVAIKQDEMESIKKEKPDGLEDSTAAMEQDEKRIMEEEEDGVVGESNAMIKQNESGKIEETKKEEPDEVEDSTAAMEQDKRIMEEEEDGVGESNATIEQNEESTKFEETVG